MRWDVIIKFEAMYRLMIFLSLLLGIGFAVLRSKRKGVPGNIIGYTVMLSVVLLLSLSIGVTFITSAGEAIGLNGTGAAVGIGLGIFTMAMITPQYKRELAGSFFMALPLMYGIGKIGCSFAGCCAGLPYHGAFSVSGREGIEVFPIQALEAAVFLLLFLGSVILDIRGHFKPVIAAIVYACAKILLDFLRDTHVEHIFSQNQIMCLVIVIVLCTMQIISAINNKDRLQVRQ
ncbi:prolipoprotein diacylglyceryl transferase family protein [Butyrivibrio sp. XBB1001]|uniref:prolipoprotein diacylglyceryl transferase family protein n=1 Tax=Butyrivibrio sp. XBB1001 TaxID=1280682 RepID=UPI00047A6AB4|nr:prolipoprotein diacylglyceryl transferase family protein [Butyrivibrio sp. XBB1001]